LYSAIGQQGNVAGHIQNFESATGINLSSDIASSLGTDFTFAIERPSLPMPGWVAAFEVVRPGVLDDAVGRLIEAHNRRTSAEHPASRMTLSRANVNGRSWTSVKTGLPSITFHWTYDRGYMIASTDRSLAARAIASRESGASLVRSINFQQRFPATGGLHHSGFVWINTNGILADLAGLIESPAVKGLMGSGEPVLVVLDGETERIRAASRSRLTSLILDAMLLHGTGESGKL